MHYHLKDFEFIRKDDADKFQSTGVFHINIHVLDYLSSRGVLLIKFQKDCFSINSINILLIYLKQTWSLPSFYGEIQDLISSENLHVILGDLLMHTFDKIVNVPTHLSGSLLDHVYVKETILQEMKLDFTLKNVYFSDHDAVKFKLSKNL